MLIGMMLVASPMVCLAALLLAIGRMERAREARIARQVALTDAIHRELGAVVAPVVTRRLGHGWRVAIAVPFERPAIVGRVVGTGRRGAAVPRAAGRHAGAFPNAAAEGK